MYAAIRGRRVLLVDFDFRRGLILRDFGGKAEKEILDLDLQNRPPAEFIQHIADLELDYLPMPRCRLDPLASPRTDATSPTSAAREVATA